RTAPPRRRSARGVEGQPPAVPLPQPRRDDTLGQLAAHELGPAETEGLLRGRVELDDLALVVDGDDAVQGRFQDRGLARLALAQPGVLLGELALEAAPLHLADLLGLALDLG